MPSRDGDRVGGADGSSNVTPALPDDYTLRRASDGSGDLVYEAPGFTARIARDGSASFRDRHVKFELKLLPLLPGPPPSGVPTLEGVLRGLGKNQRRHQPGSDPRLAPGPPRDPTADAIRDETRDPSTTFSRYRPDPREVCQYPRPCFFDAPLSLVNARAKFDITDELMRMKGQDPYRYEKARFLTATREMRARLAARAQAEDFARSGGELGGRLQSIACDGSLRPTQRRAIIEALRTELDTGTPGGRALAEEIQRFLHDHDLEDLDRHDGGVRCPAVTLPPPP